MRRTIRLVPCRSRRRPSRSRGILGHRGRLVLPDFVVNRRHGLRLRRGHQTRARRPGGRQPLPTRVVTVRLFRGARASCAATSLHRFEEDPLSEAVALLALAVGKREELCPGHARHRGQGAEHLVSGRDHVRQGDLSSRAWPGAGTRPPEVRYFSGLAARAGLGARRELGAGPDRGACAWIALRDRGQVREPGERGGTPAKSSLAAGVPVR